MMNQKLKLIIHSGSGICRILQPFALPCTVCTFCWSTCNVGRSCNFCWRSYPAWCTWPGTIMPIIFWCWVSSLAMIQLISRMLIILILCLILVTIFYTRGFAVEPRILKSPEWWHLVGFCPSHRWIFFVRATFSKSAISFRQHVGQRKLESPCFAMEQTLPQPSNLKYSTNHRYPNVHVVSTEWIFVTPNFPASNKQGF